MVEGYKQVKLLGEGAFGKCYLFENAAGSKRVIKQIDISKMSQKEKKEAYHEAKIMGALDHPNIIHFLDVYTTTNGKLNIVMDYADGGDLFSKIKSQRGRHLAESVILDIFVQICLALKHVHDRKILHRDLKGQNIFLQRNGMVKLGDFGIAKVLSSTMDKARTLVGTPYYLSPEVVENKPYSFKSDVWSLGVVLYELCALRPPFDANSLHDLALRIVRGQFNPVPPQFSMDLKNLVAQLLSTDANRRPSIAKILHMPFIRNRISRLLTESIRIQEFSHTILHKQHALDPKPKVNPRENPLESAVKPPEHNAKPWVPKEKPMKEPLQRPPAREEPRRSPNPFQPKPYEPLKYRVPVPPQGVSPPFKKPLAQDFRGHLEDLFKPVPKRPDLFIALPNSNNVKKKQQQKEKIVEIIKQQREQRESEEKEKEMRKQQFEREREERGKQREESRKNFRKDLEGKRQKAKLSRNHDSEVEWIGDVASYVKSSQEPLTLQNTQEPADGDLEIQWEPPEDRKRFVQQLEEVMNEPEKEEEDKDGEDKDEEETHITLENDELHDEELVDREDELTDVGDNGTTFVFPTYEEELSRYTGIEIFRLHLEELLGTDKLFLVYSVLQKFDLQENQIWDYDTVYSELQSILDPSDKHCIQLVHSLIFLEQKAEQQ